MGEILEEFSSKQKNLLKEIAFRNGISDFNIEVKPGSTKGDNYLSITKTVAIKDRDTGKTVNIFIKNAPTSIQLREQMPVNAIFRNEISFYEVTLPKFRALHDSMNVGYKFPKLPKFFGKMDEDRQECVILEDLKASGFRLWPKTVPMDSNHIKLALEECAKIHAFSFFIKDKLPEELTKMEKRHGTLFADLTLDQTESNRKMFDDIIELLDNEEFTPALKRAKENIEQFFGDLKKEKTVLVHGDCWCNNTLFRYEDEQNPHIPTEASLIDWQITTVGTPVTDLANVFLTMAPKEILDDYQNYLSFYHQSLSKMVRELGGEPDKIFPYSELQRHWKKYSLFGLYMIVFWVRAIFGDPAESLDMEDVAEAGSSFMDAFRVEAVGNERLRKRVGDVVSFMIENHLM